MQSIFETKMSYQYEVRRWRPSALGYNQSETKRNVLEIFLFQIILKSYDMRHTIWLIIPDFLILDQHPI